MSPGQSHPKSNPMRLHKIHRFRAAFDLSAPKEFARIPVQFTFRHMPASPAVAAQVEAEAQKLRRYFSLIRHCHVVITAPHHHHRLGRTYSVHVELAVPNEHIAVTHAHAGRPHALDESPRKRADAAHKDIYVVLRDVFDAARRRLQDYARRRRGDGKRHAGATLT